FIQMFGNIVLGVSKEDFEHILTKAKEGLGVKFDTELKAEDLKNIIALIHLKFFVIEVALFYCSI
ncbi:MAG: hypothetical protein ABH806_03035, partial [Candidatus Omnitrophota bacterium]